MSDIGTSTGAIYLVPILNEESPDLSIPFDETSETMPQVGNDEQDSVRHLAQELTEQLTKFRGYCNDCHQAAQRNRIGDPNEQISLAIYLEFTPELGPDILSSKTIACQRDDLARKMSPESRGAAFRGLDSRAEIPHICLDEDERVSNDAGFTFDLDSIIAFPNNLAIAKRGIRWSPTRMTVSDFQSDLHLRSIPVIYFDTNGMQHQVHRPVHQIPHYTFGSVVGFEDISLYFLFPNLYREKRCSRLRDEDFRLWMDGILLPAIYQCHSSAHVQHYPSSYDHSRYNSTARGVETLSQCVHPVAREQQLVYYLPPEAIADVWADILASVQEPGFQQFQDVTILIQAKNLKILTKDVTWEKMAFPGSSPHRLGCPVELFTQTDEPDQQLYWDSSGMKQSQSSFGIASDKGFQGDLSERYNLSWSTININKTLAVCSTKFLASRQPTKLSNRREDEHEPEIE
ncbi:hypothetical protein AUP68_10981 [Ilyonectria robusta]